MTASPLATNPAALAVPRSLLIGRERELAEVRALLLRDAVPLVTLTGPGGVGKTRLARRVGADLLTEFADGVCFVSLDPVRDPGLLVATVAEALGMREMGGRPLTERLTAYLRDRHLLLILDNVEHLLAAVPDIAQLLTACPRLTVLATSRVILRLTGEHAFPVLPLAYPDPTDQTPGATAAEYDAVRLFLARAQAVSPSFAPPPAQLATIAAICARLDGLPLAIELAAARVGHLPLRTLVDRMERALPLLTGGPRDAPMRLRTMRDAIAWSHALLDAAEQRLFRRLAVFRGGFALDAAEVIATGFDDTDGDVLDLVASLVDKSLLRPAEDAGPASGPPRYRMLETIREFALEQLDTSGEADAVRHAHAAAFLALAEQSESELIGPDELVWMERLAAEHANLRAALDWSTGKPAPEIGLRLVGALGDFWTGLGAAVEGSAWAERALAVAGEGFPVIRAKVLHSATDCAKAQGDADRAAALNEQRYRVCQHLSDPGCVAQAIFQRGDIARMQGKFDEAAALLKDALTRFRALDDGYWITLTRGALGQVSLARADYAGAYAASEALEAAAEQMGSNFLRTWAVDIRMRAACGQGDHDLTARLAKRHLLLAQQRGHGQRMADSLAVLASVANLTGGPVRSARLLGAAEALYATIGLALSPLKDPADRRLLAAIRGRSDGVLLAAYAEGHALTCAEAIASAIADGGHRRCRTRPAR